MRILQLCVRFPPAPGGVEEHVLQISKNLQKRDHQVTVFTSDLYKETPFEKLDDSDSNSKKEVIDGISVRRFKAHTLGDEMHYVFAPSMLPAILKSDVDLIHAHSYGHFHVNLATLAKKVTGIPLVFTAHFHPDWSMWGGDKRRSLRKIYDKVLGRSVFDIADRIIVHTSNELKLIAPMGIDEKKAQIIPAGVDLSSFDTADNGELFRNEYDVDAPFILYAGRLAGNKGLTYLISAFSKVLKTSGLEGMKLILVGGDHGVRAELESHAFKSEINNNILFTGHVKDEKIFRSAFSACELLALPSDYEAFGLVLVEAMASKKPCVATRVGGVPDVIDNERSGYLVEYGDVDALAEAMIKVLSDKQKALAMGKAGRAIVEERFTWDKVTDQLEELYSNVKGGNSNNGK